MLQDRLRADPLWLALDDCMGRLRSDCRNVLYQRDPNDRQGLNAAMINRLAGSAGLCVDKLAIFNIQKMLDQGLEIERFLSVTHDDNGPPLTWKTWDRYRPCDQVDPHKIKAMIDYLRRWQSRRAKQLRRTKPA